MYRKLFRQMFIFVVVIFGTGMVQAVVFELFKINESTTKLFDMMLNIILAIGIGFVGNYFYIRQSDRNIKAILSSVNDEEERMARLKKVGGVSNIPYYILIFLVLCGVILALINN